MVDFLQGEGFRSLAKDGLDFLHLLLLDVAEVGLVELLAEPVHGFVDFVHGLALALLGVGLLGLLLLGLALHHLLPPHSHLRLSLLRPLPPHPLPISNYYKLCPANNLSKLQDVVVCCG